MANAVTRRLATCASQRRTFSALRRLVVFYVDAGGVPPGFEAFKSDA